MERHRLRSVLNPQSIIRNVDPRAAKAALQYDARLERNGRLERLDPYITSSTPIAHRCLQHSEVHLARPSDLLQGKGLHCCLVAARKVEGLRRRNKAAAKYDTDLAKIGKLERLEEYQTALKPIMHRCLIHGLEKAITPNNALSGKGLRCCQYAATQGANLLKSEKQRKSYDRVLVEHGLLERIDPYIDATTPIRHRCLIHGYEDLQIPSQARNGRGLACCRNASVQRAATRRKNIAAKLYDKRLAEYGRIVRIEDYMGRQKKILHRCILHNEDHNIDPGNALQGKGLPCCSAGAGWDTLQRVLDDLELATANEAPCSVYIYAVKDNPGLFKIGIAINPSNRAKQVASKGMYGDLVASWQVSTRRNAVLIETALLRDKSFKQTDDSLVPHLESAAGYSEIRQANQEELVKFTDRLVTMLEDPECKWAEWALNNIPNLRIWEIKNLTGRLTKSLSN